jgi:hypothetical protein
MHEQPMQAPCMDHTRAKQIWRPAISGMPSFFKLEALQAYCVWISVLHTVTVPLLPAQCAGRLAPWDSMRVASDARGSTGCRGCRQGQVASGLRWGSITLLTSCGESCSAVSGGSSMQVAGHVSSAAG